MSDMEMMARRLVGEKAFLDEAQKLHQETREAAGGVFAAGDRKDLGDLGMVYVTKPKGSWRISDEDALLAWLQQHAPLYLAERTIPARTVVEVSPLLLRELDDGRLPDADGELVAVPGVEFRPGNPTLTVKASAAAHALARASLTRELDS